MLEYYVMFWWELNKGLAEILLSAQHLLVWSFSHNNSANLQHIEADVETNTHSASSEYSLWTAHEQSAGQEFIHWGNKWIFSR